MIIIRAKKAGFRRCGIAHTVDPVEYDNDHFSKEELGTLEAENMLIVTKDGRKGKPKASQEGGE